MNKTLIEYVQDILNDMDEDPVNSIDDSFVGQQVAQIVRSTYEALMSNRNWPHMRKLLQLEFAPSTNTPTHIVMPKNINELDFINYNVAQVGVTALQYREVKWKEPDAFLRFINNRNSDNDNVLVASDPSGIQLLILNDKAPDFYTSFDDTDLVFDSYDTQVDSAIQPNKIQAQAYVFPEWTHLDDFVPDIPQASEVLLLEEAKSRAMFKLKQTVDSKAEAERTRQSAWQARKARRANGGVKYPNYGRTGKK